jgi:hypothetical protein
MTTQQNVGGTSGNAASTNNMLSVNLGGVNANFDLGPSTNAVASNAYNFLSNSFNTDANLLGNTILGSQNFLNGVTQPVLGMAENEEQVDSTTLPAMFTTLANQNFTLGGQAINADTQVAQASIASSTAAAAQANRNSGGGGFCYLTTICCDALGLADDCYVLRTLRSFRDGFMSATAERRAMIQEYYRDAPGLVDAIIAAYDYQQLCGRLFSVYIVEAVKCIEHGDFESALIVYRALVADVKETFRG